MISARQEDNSSDALGRSAGNERVDGLGGSTTAYQVSAGVDARCEHAGRSRTRITNLEQFSDCDTRVVREAVHCQ
jgi:hypothetical protein